MSRQVIPGKYAGESRVVAFNFLSQLDFGDSVASAVTVATVFSGVDLAPAIVSGPAVVSGTLANQVVSAGIIGVIYDLACSALTTNGRTLTINAFLAILPGQP